MSDHQSDPLLDEQLRRVALPDGLRDRLRQIAREPDHVDGHDIDVSLCDVSLYHANGDGGTKGDAAKGDGGWSDAKLDQALAETPAPTGMLDRLHAVVDEEMIDEALRQVVVPRAVTARLRLIPLLRRRSRVGRAVLAASLILMLFGTHVASLGMMGLVARMPEVATVAIDLPYGGPLELESPASEMELEVPAETELAASVPLSEDLSIQRQLDMQLINFLPAPVTTLTGDVVADLNNGFDLEQDIFLTRFRLLGARRVADDEMTELEMSPRLPKGGLEPPLVRQFNRRFLLQHNVHPPVSPAGHETLRRVQVPLVTDTTSFNTTARKIARGRLPEPSEVRVEEFVAAAGNFFEPPADGNVAVRITAGPSTFGQRINKQLAEALGWPPSLAEQPAGLLQIGVVAGNLPPAAKKPTHLTIALDVSASMRWGQRLEMVQAALRHLVHQMGEHDRISVVAFNEGIVHQLQGVDRGQQWRLLDLCDKLKAAGGTDLAAGLQASVVAASDQPWEEVDAQQKLVVVTDARTALPSDTQREVERMLAMAEKMGLRLTILELNERRPAESSLIRLAKAANGRFEQLMSPERLRWNLVEQLLGRSATVATNARLTVTFRPQTVTAYRLFGHEPASASGMTETSLRTQLRAGDEASALFEVWLKPEGGELVGHADIEWRDAGGKLRRARQLIHRTDFSASSAGSSSLSLQAAAIAAEAAEVLRGSPFADSPTRRLGDVLEAARRSDPLLRRKYEFRRFLATLRKAEQVRLRGQRD